MQYRNQEIESIYQKFGAKVELLRVTKGLSQTELAKRVGLTRGSICNIEAGRQRILLADIEKFAQAFAITPERLLRDLWK